MCIPSGKVGGKAPPARPTNGCLHCRDNCRRAITESWLEICLLEPLSLLMMRSKGFCN